MKKNLLIFIAIFGAIILSTCKKDEPAPVANFTTDKTTAMVNSSITFTNSSTNATSYTWSFGDGNSSTDKDPVHVYTTAGTFSVTLTATGKGGTNSKSVTITISPSATGQWAFTSINTSTSYTANGTMNITENDDNTLTGDFVFSDGSGYSEFKTGSKISGTTVTIKLIWTISSTNYSVTYSGNINSSYTYINQGNYFVNGSQLGSWTANLTSKKAAIVSSRNVEGSALVTKVLNLIK